MREGLTQEELFSLIQKRRRQTSGYGPLRLTVRAPIRKRCMMSTAILMWSFLCGTAGNLRKIPDGSETMERC